ncbi:MAG: hypothetical protein WC728_07240 [Elusimicrobiota bacterium]
MTRGTPGLKPVKRPEDKSIARGQGVWESQTPTIPALPRFRDSRFDAAQQIAKVLRVGHRDLAFIGAGLAVFLLAPCAAFFCSLGESPENPRQGFGPKALAGLEAGSPFEDGVRSLAPGNLPGVDPALITPLNAGDPLELIQRPDFKEEAEPIPQGAREELPARAASGWREAVSSAAKRGVATAVKRARLPSPTVKLAARLRGLSSFTEAKGSSASLAPLSSRGLVARAPRETHLSRISPTSDYRGMEMRSSAASAGGRPGNYLDPKRTLASGGSASLPGHDSVSAGSGSAGAGSSGGMSSGRGGPEGSVSAPGPSTAQDNRNISVKEKESLAEMAKKMNMQQAIQLKWDKKRYNQIERKKMAEQIAMQTASQALLKVLDKLLEGGGGGEGGGESGGGGGNGMQGAAEGVGNDMDGMLAEEKKTKDEKKEKGEKLDEQKQELEKKEQGLQI